jgi:hypothetical protein
VRLERKSSGVETRAENGGSRTEAEDTGSGAEAENTGSETGGGDSRAGDGGLRPLDGLSTSGGIQKQALKAIVVVVDLLGARLPIW